MKSRIRQITCGHRPFVAIILLFTMIGSLQAADPNTFQLDWFEHALSTNSKFRIVFTTSSRTNALSSIGSDYDALVTRDATQGVLTAGIPEGDGWRAIVSTSSGENAKTRTSMVDGDDVQVYRIDGVRLAKDYADFWDGTREASMNVDEDGTALSNSTHVWTGTSSSGTSVPGRTLGMVSDAGSDQGNERAAWGKAFKVDDQGVFTSSKPLRHSHSLYAISDVFSWNGFDATLATDDSADPGIGAVPEPTSFRIFATFVVLCLRKRQRVSLRRRHRPGSANTC